MVDLAVERRRMASVLQRDPVMLRFLEEHEPFRRVMARVNRLLMGGAADRGARVQAAVLASAIAGTVVHPLALELDDAPRWERFYFVTGDAPFETAPVVGAASQIDIEKTVDQPEKLDLPEDLDQFVVSLEKGIRQ